MSENLPPSPTGFGGFNLPAGRQVRLRKSEISGLIKGADWF